MLEGVATFFAWSAAIFLVAIPVEAVRLGSMRQHANHEGAERVAILAGWQCAGVSRERVAFDWQAGGDGRFTGDGLLLALAVRNLV